MNLRPSALDTHRYELLPFESAEREAAAVGIPLTLTVTCSPKHGPEKSVEVGRRLVELGHSAIVHLAARMVRSREDLDQLLTTMATSRVRHIFVIGGDVHGAAGPYQSGLELLEDLHRHPLRPQTIGIPGYPEGHPHIADSVLAEDLRRKGLLADYIVTQMCFDFQVARAWLEQTRDEGVAMPVYIGVPGIVGRKRLLEISVRVGVGRSIAYLHKQRAIRNLLSGARGAAEQLYDAVGPHIGGELGIAGVHFFTFNRLVETRRVIEQRALTMATETA